MKLYDHLSDKENVLLTVEPLDRVSIFLEDLNIDIIHPLNYPDYANCSEEEIVYGILGHHYEEIYFYGEFHANFWNYMESYYFMTKKIILNETDIRYDVIWEDKESFLYRLILDKGYVKTK